VSSEWAWLHQFLNKRKKRAAKFSAARRFVQMSADIRVGLFVSILLAYSPLLN
jgi:hypothetical protein